MLAAIISYLPDAVSAALTACSVSYSPQTVAPGSDSIFNFNVTNQSAQPIAWVKIIRPGGGYTTIEAAAATGWDAINTAGLTIFTNGNIANSSSQDFIVEATGNNVTPSPVNWSVLVSDNPGGSSPIGCSGDLSFNVSTQPSTINIADVAATDVTDQAATINWTTDIPSTTQVHYGTDSSYGSNSLLNSSLVTDHSVSLSGLSAETGYHYQVASTTTDGGSADSGDNTFLTNPAAQSSGSTPSNNAGSGGGQLLGGGVALLSKPTEKVVPTIILSTVLNGVFKTAPTIQGVADDNLALARIQYSSDGGTNWLPVDQAIGLGGRHASFSFTPLLVKEGNYAIVVRAVDTSGNIGSSAAQTLIIDRLPPLIGGNIISIGPQLLSPNSAGLITSLVGVDQRITVSAVGGPTTLDLTAQPLTRTAHSQSFQLTQSTSNGLWSGIMSFTNPGEYTLVGNAVDGAGNKTTHVMGMVSVLRPSQTIDSHNQRPVISKLTVYYWAPDTQNWVVWDGAPYGQTNPQTTDQQGSFSLFLPPGKYYLQATAPGYHTTISRIFQSSHSVPLTTTIDMRRLGGLHLGYLHLSWSGLTTQPVTITTNQPTSGKLAVTNQEVGRQAPSFTLTDSNGRIVHNADLLGKPTIISFGASWLPNNAAQTTALSQLQSNADINVVAVALQEDAARVQAATAIANLQLNWLVDPTGSQTNSFAVQTLPTNYFLDRKGIVRKVLTGTLTKQQIIDAISQL